LNILIINKGYLESIEWLYESYPELKNATYEEQAQARYEKLCTVDASYAYNLRAIGVSANEIQARNPFAQFRWAYENGYSVGKFPHQIIRARRVLKQFVKICSRQQITIPLQIISKILTRLELSLTSGDWFNDILINQISNIKPDILIIRNIGLLPPSFFRQYKAKVFLVGQHDASPIPKGSNLRHCDLLLFSSPRYVDYYQSQGLNSELFRFGFEASILSRIPNARKDIPISFIGSIQPEHASRREWLAEICKVHAPSYWLRGIEQIQRRSPIKNAYRGEVYGISMFDVLNRSQIVINQHIDSAGDYADNMRMFEATGVGSLLVTDNKSNIADFFMPDQEIVTYKNTRECIEKLTYYLANEKYRLEIGSRGQTRTLQDHTYRIRVEEMLNCLARYL